MSARTGGTILLQLIFDMARPGGQVDRVLNGPTNAVWIDPWLEHLTSLGVDYRREHQVQGIELRDGRVSGVDVSPAADAARQRRLLRRGAAGGGDAAAGHGRDEAAGAAPGEPAPPPDPLDERIMFYLDRDVSLVNGHTLYIDSQWALTSISQAQFWPAVEWSRSATDG
jgi:hypothetical protein